MRREELAALWAAPPDREALAAECRAACGSWIWTRETSDRWTCGPHGEARHGRRPGRDLKREPKRRHRVERYGYDADGALRIAERFSRGDVTHVLLEVPLEHGRLRWDFSDGDLVLLEHCVAGAGGRPRRLGAYFGPPFGWGHTVEEYEYDADGRPARVRFDRAGRDYDSLPELETFRRGTVRFEYTSDGELAAVIEEYDGDRPSMMRYFAVADTWGTLRDRLLDGLAAAYGPAIEAHGPAAAGLSYADGAPGLFPPSLTLCSADCWARAGERFGDDRLRFNPAEWGAATAVAPPDAVARDCEAARMVLSQDRAPDNAQREFSLDLARRLARPGLVVVVADLEFEDFERNRAALS